MHERHGQPDILSTTHEATVVGGAGTQPTLDEVPHEHFDPPRPFPIAPQVLGRDGRIPLEILRPVDGRHITALLPLALLLRRGEGAPPLVLRREGPELAELTALVKGAGEVGEVPPGLAGWMAMPEELSEQLCHYGGVHSWRCCSSRRQRRRSCALVPARWKARSVQPPVFGRRFNSMVEGSRCDWPKLSTTDPWR